MLNLNTHQQNMFDSEGVSGDKDFDAFKNAQKSMNATIQPDEHMVSQPNHL